MQLKKYELSQYMNNESNIDVLKLINNKITTQQLAKEIENWVLYLLYAKNHSQNSITGYVKDILKIIIYLHNQNNEIISIDSMSNFQYFNLRNIFAHQKHIYDNNNTTIRRCIAALRSFYTYITKNSTLSNHKGLKQSLETIISFPNPKHIQNPPNFLSIQDVKNIDNHYKKNMNYWVYTRDYAIFLLLYGSGLRINELISIDIENCFKMFETSLLKIKGKGGKERFTPVLNKCINVIKKYLEQTPKTNEKSLFIGEKHHKRINASIINKNLQKITKITNCEKISAHVLRHSYATHLLSKGADLRSIQELLGHVNLTTTQIYTHIQEDEMISTLLESHPLWKKN